MSAPVTGERGKRSHRDTLSVIVPMDFQDCSEFLFLLMKQLRNRLPSIGIFLRLEKPAKVFDVE